MLVIGCDPTITDPCPGQLSCPGEQCCASGYPYHCGTQCYAAPCGAGQITCVSAERTDGCYGGTWSGSYTGLYHPAGGGMLTLSGSMMFEITNHALTSTMPSGGTGSIDCSSGVGSLTLPATSAQPLVFTGTWMHTSDMGDKIMSATMSATSGTVDGGTWTAVRIF